jgi:hypothetical protein
LDVLGEGAQEGGDAAADRVSGADAVARKAGYQRLFQVSIEHDYYNVRERRCIDFQAFPNARSVALMRSLGLLFRADADRFSVFYNADRGDALARYVRGETTRQPGEAEPEYWTHLSFFLATQNPKFGTLTDMPLSMHPLADNFYLSNEGAHGRGARHVLAGGESLSVRDLVGVKPARFHVDVPKGGVATLSDVSGAVYQTLGDDPTKGPPYYADLTLLNEGWYALDVTGRPRERFIHTIVQPAPLGYLHLLIAAPREGAAGIYPLTFSQDGSFEIASREYVVRFRARSTRWVYNIVARARLSSSLSIEGTVNGAQRPVVFDGPIEAKLPNGQDVLQFVSKSALPLQQRSDVKLRLKGKRQGMSGEDRVLCDRLPVASAEHVPRVTDQGTFSDIYVYI